MKKKIVFKIGQRYKYILGEKFTLIKITGNILLFEFDEGKAFQQSKKQFENHLNKTINEI